MGTAGTMRLHPDLDLKAYNTFQLQAKSAIGAFVTSEDELRQVFAAADDHGLPVRILGGEPLFHFVMRPWR